jgi:hypothetical protein
MLAQTARNLLPIFSLLLGWGNTEVDLAMKCLGQLDEFSAANKAWMRSRMDNQCDLPDSCQRPNLAGVSQECSLEEEADSLTKVIEAEMLLSIPSAGVTAMREDIQSVKAVLQNAIVDWYASDCGCDVENMLAVVTRLVFPKDPADDVVVKFFVRDTSPPGKEGADGMKMLLPVLERFIALVLEPSKAATFQEAMQTAMTGAMPDATVNGVVLPIPPTLATENLLSLADRVGTTEAPTGGEADPAVNKGMDKDDDSYSHLFAVAFIAYIHA